MIRFCRLILLLVLVARGHGLRLLDIRVPQYGDLLGSVTMTCDFKLEDTKLYSVKWYKNDFEFFRYIPDNTPRTQSLPVTGIQLDLSASNMTTITLIQLGFNSSGTYRCEVSTEAPNFKTVVGSGNMTIRALPADDPVIEGVQPSYSVGEYISANCTSRRSYPPAELAWYINGVKVEKWFAEYSTEGGRPDADGLYSRSLSLRYQVQRRHEQGPARLLELRCSAAVAGETRHAVVKPALGPAPDQQLAQERLANTAPNEIRSTRTICFLMTSALLLSTS